METSAKHGPKGGRGSWNSVRLYHTIIRIPERLLGEAHINFKYVIKQRWGSKVLEFGVLEAGTGIECKERQLFFYFVLSVSKKSIVLYCSTLYYI